MRDKMKTAGGGKEISVKEQMRKTVSGLVFWGCLLLIGLFAIPLGICMGIILFIVKVLDFAMDKFGRNKR